MVLTQGLARTLVLFWACLMAVPFAFSGVALAALSDNDKEIYAAAFRAFNLDSYNEAMAIAKEANDPLLQKTLTFLSYRESRHRAGFDELYTFMMDNQDWPDTYRLKLKVEDKMPRDFAADKTVEWFEAFSPRTAEGKEKYIDALLEMGRTDDAVAVIQDLWLNHTFVSSMERRLYKKYKKYLTQDDHIARLDTLLWDHATRSAQRMYYRVPKEYKKLAQARIGLYRRAGNADSLVAAVPKSLKDDEGLMYERTVWRRKHRLHKGAREMLETAVRKVPAGQELKQPHKWWRERHYQARKALGKKHFYTAYELVSSHRQTGGADMAAAEFMAGWIAFSFLNKPEEALKHFTTLHDNVSYPVSLARGAYWAGRAAARTGDEDLALEWFRKAGKHNTTFYGQLAYLERTKDVDLDLPRDVRVSRTDHGKFRNHELVQVIRQLHEVGQNRHARVFVQHFMYDDSYTPAFKALVAGLSQQIERHDLAVKMSRKLMQDHVPLVVTGYPLVEIPASAEKAVEPALVNAIIRQESGFDVAAKSHANARGLMQLMPSTARAVARNLKMRYSAGRLTRDGGYNVTLGQAYLDEVLETFDGSYVLAIAAYNAGPHRVKRWIRAYGDPRKDTDVVTWIEQIPYSETRNYVQRVLENLSVYRAQLEQVPFSSRQLATMKLEGDQNPLYAWNKHVNDLAWTRP